MLTEVQQRVVLQMQKGSVVGELSSRVNGRFELFTKLQGFIKPKSLNDSCRFDVERINKSTVFALLEIGIIERDDFIETMMSPFSRDCWYVYKKAQKVKLSKLWERRMKDE